MFSARCANFAPSFIVIIILSLGLILYPGSVLLPDKNILARARAHARKFYFMGNSVTRHYSYALERKLSNESDIGGERETEKVACPKDAPGCDRGQIKYLWKNWPLHPRPTEQMPVDHLVDGCEVYERDIKRCLEDFFHNASVSDVLIVGSNYAFTSICQYGREEDAYDTAREDIPEALEILLEVFPGTIFWHSLGPVRLDHPRHDEHRWIRILNNITRAIIANTRAIYIDSHAYLADKRAMFEDVIHHPGPPSEGVVNMFLAAIAKYEDPLRLVRSSHSTRNSCGGFLDEYIHFHRSSLQALKEDPVHAIVHMRLKVLVFKPCLDYDQGFADRIAGMQKAFLVALCTQRVFLVDWPAIQNLFIQDAIDWSYVPTFWEDVLNTLRFQANISAGSYINVAYDTTPTGVYIDRFSRPNSDPFVRIHFNRAVSRELLATTECGASLRTRGASENNLFGCVARLLLKPTPDVLNTHMATANAVLDTAKSIAVHIRAGDDVLHEGGQEVSDEIITSLFDRARCFEDENLTSGKPRFFLMTDNLRVKQRVLQLFPTQFYVTKIEPKHVAFSQVAAEYAAVVAEWYIYSVARYHIIEQHSGLSRTSYAYALTQYPTYFRQGPDCLPRRPADLVDDGAKL